MDITANRILVIKLGALGDVILAEGALRDIRAHHQGARITALTGLAYRRIMERCPWVDAVELDSRAHPLRPGPLVDVWRRLSAGRYDMVYDLQNNLRTGVYRRLLLRGIPWSGIGRGGSHPYRVDDPNSIPVLNRLAGQLAAAGVPVVHTPEPDVSWMADDPSELMRRAGIAEGFILLVPGSAAEHAEKRWPGYAALARLLIADGHQVVTAPGPDEIELCRALPGTMLMDGEKPVDFFKLAGLALRARFVVGNDTGPTHLAAHVGTNGLALYGPHKPAAITCLDRRFKIIETDDLDTLAVETVHAAIRAELGAGHGA